MIEEFQDNRNDDGTCITTGCNRPATKILTLRTSPIVSFPEGLLTKSHYCFDDAMWFLGVHISKYGSTFVSLDDVEE